MKNYTFQFGKTALTKLETQNSLLHYQDVVTARET